MPHFYTLTEQDLRGLDDLRIEKRGVVRKNGAATMNTTANVLVVGLGGIGIDTVCRLKNALRERVGELHDDEIRFLAVDTDMNCLLKWTDYGPLRQQEAFHLFNSGIGAISAAPEHCRPAAMQQIWPHKRDNFGFVLSGMGANQVRLASRVSLMEPNLYQNLCGKLREAISGMKSFTRRRLEVHVIAGLGGGTGSGLCVDIPYIIRAVAGELNIPDANMRVLGHLYLPDVFAEIPINLPNMYRNTYAALKEIDYYMNIEQIGETFDVLYPSGPASFYQNIFDSCTLIDGTSVVVSDTKAMAVNTCVEYLVSLVTGISAMGPQNATMASVVTSSYFGSNLGAGLSAVMHREKCNFHEGGNYKYTCVGAAVLRFPADAIGEFLIGRCYQKMIAGMEEKAQALTQADIKTFAKSLVADPLNVVHAYIERYNRKMNGFLESSELTRETIKSDWVETNQRSIINELKTAFGQTKDWVARACDDAKQQAAKIFCDPARGPFYLARLLTARFDRDGIAGYYEMLSSYAAFCDDMLEKLQRERKSYSEQLNELKSVMLKPFCFRRYLDSFKDVIHRAGQTELAIWLYQILRDEYRQYAEERVSDGQRLRQMLDAEFLRPVDTISRVGQILGHNAEVCREEIFGKTASDSIFSMDAPGIEMLKNCVRNDVNRKLEEFDDQAASNFQCALITQILGNPDAWSSGSHCAVALREFVNGYPTFREFLNKSWSQYMDETYGLGKTLEKTAVLACIENYVAAKAEPMFSTVSGFSWSDVPELCINCMIAPSQMGQSWNQKILLQGTDQNAIYYYTMCFAIPAWLHRNMAKYESCYYQLRSAGIHIDENPQSDPPYAEYPPLLPPQQWHRAGQGSIAYQNDMEVAFRTSLAEIIRKAEQLGILVPDEAGFYEVLAFANRPGEEEWDKFCQKYAQDSENNADGVLQDGARLCNEMRAAFGSVNHPVMSVGGLSAHRSDHLPELLRKQMMLFSRLRSEVRYAENASARLADTKRRQPVVENIPQEQTVGDAQNYVFISYSTQNQAAADAMREFLRKNGVRVWMAPMDIPAGRKYAQVISQAIKGCSGVVLMLSNYAQNSIWVSKEIERAIHYRKLILPVKLENVVLNDEFELYISTDQIVAVPKIDENSEELRRVLSSVVAMLGR